MSLQKKLISWFLSFLFVMNYALSFFLPTFAIEGKNKNDVYYGYDAFAFAFFSIRGPEIFGGYYLFMSWLANPTLWFGVICFAIGRRIIALFAGILATAMASFVVLFAPKGVPLFVGYYAWVMSMWMFTAVVSLTIIWESMEKSAENRGHSPQHG